MADLLNYLPFFGNTPLVGPSSSDVFGGNQTTTGTNFIGPPEHTTIGGLPVMPMLAALAGAGLGFGFGNKYNKNQQAGRGAGLFYQLVNRPIEEERRRNDIMMQAMIRQRTFTPVAQQASQGSNVTDFQPATGNESMTTAPTSYQAPAPVMAKPVTTWGGVPLYATPQVPYGKLFPNAPSAIAGMGTTLTPELAVLSAKLTEQEKQDQALAKQVTGLPGYFPGMSREGMANLYNYHMGQERSQKMIQGLPELPANAGRQYTYNADGTISVVQKQAPVDLIQFKREQAQAATEANRAQRDVALKNLDFAQARLDWMKSKQGTVVDQKTKEAIAGYNNQIKAYGEILHSIHPDALGKFTPEAQTLYANTVNKISEMTDEISDMGHQLRGIPTETQTPADKANAIMVERYKNAFMIAPDPNKVSVPKGPNQDLFLKTRAYINQETKPIVEQIDDHMKATGKPWLSRPEKEWEDQMRAIYPEFYDKAVQMWQNQRKSGSMFVPPAPSSSPTETMSIVPPMS